jgi:mono/diheme cytochrome c family protein
MRLVMLLKKVTMKKIVITFVTITAIGIASCSVRKAEGLTGKNYVPENETASRGERVFMASCQKCHPGGEGGLGPSINSNPAPQFIKRFQMRHGLGAMPSFKKDEISKSDLRAISKYLHDWKSY